MDKKASILYTLAVAALLKEADDSETSVPWYSRITNAIRGIGSPAPAPAASVAPPPPPQPPTPPPVDYSIQHQWVHPSKPNETYHGYQPPDSPSEGWTVQQP